MWLLLWLLVLTKGSINVSHYYFELTPTPDYYGKLSYSACNLEVVTHCLCDVIVRF